MHISQALQRATDQTKPSAHAKPPAEATPKQVVLLNDPKGREKLSSILLVCYDGLKVYGKEPEQLENLIALFQLVLADYAIADIDNAFRLYMRTNSEMPAPADIAQIIDRKGKPPFERTVYVSISKKQPDLRTSAEWEYMADYERFQISGKH